MHLVEENHENETQRNISRTIGIRIDEETLRRVDLLRKAVEGREACARLSRSNAIVRLLRRGLEAEEAKKP